MSAIRGGDFVGYTMTEFIDNRLDHFFSDRSLYNLSPVNIEDLRDCILLEIIKVDIHVMTVERGGIPKVGTEAFFPENHHIVGICHPMVAPFAVGILEIVVLELIGNVDLFSVRKLYLLIFVFSRIAPAVVSRGWVFCATRKNGQHHCRQQKMFKFHMIKWF